jgi:hypothetical protein
LLAQQVYIDQLAAVGLALREHIQGSLRKVSADDQSEKGNETCGEFTKAVPLAQITVTVTDGHGHGLLV